MTSYFLANQAKQTCHMIDNFPAYFAPHSVDHFFLLTS